MKLRTLIIDDEPIALEKLRNYVEKVPFLENVASCRNGIDAAAIIATQSIDVVFTDINMPDMSGMEFMASLSKPPLVVFITAYPDYAVESYKLSAVDYILKPYGFTDFQRAANKALERHQSAHNAMAQQNSEVAPTDSNDSLFVKVDYRFVRISLSDITYIKGYGEYLQIHTAESPSPVLTLSSFNSLLQKLPSNFLQVHRSYVVNMNAIKSVNKSRIIFDSDVVVPIGDSYKDAFVEYLSAHSIGTSQKK